MMHLAILINLKYYVKEKYYIKSIKFTKNQHARNFSFIYIIYSHFYKFSSISDFLVIY